MATNPFEALLTPDKLQAAREAELDKKYEGAGFWGREMARAGASVRQALREKGEGLTPDDRKAALNQSLMQASAQSYAGMVKDGMDPDMARIRVLEETLNQFMAAGEYATAITFMPQIESLKKAQAERRKLTAEATWTEEYKPQIEEAKAEAAARRAEAAGDTAEAARIRAQAAADRVASQNRKDEAKAGLDDRTDPNLRGTKGTDSDKGPPKTANTSDIADYNKQVAGGLGLLRRASQYRSLLASRPQVGAPPAQWQAWAQSQMKGLVATLGGGVSPQVLDEESRKAYDAAASRVAVTANKLNVDVAAFRSLALDLAYAIAKVNDPGGRLSNQDFDTALAILGGGPDATAAIKTLDQTVRNSVENLMAIGRGNKTLREGVETLPELESEYKKWTDSFEAPKPEGESAAAKRLREIKARMDAQ